MINGMGYGNIGYRPSFYPAGRPSSQSSGLPYAQSAGSFLPMSDSTRPFVGYSPSMPSVYHSPSRVPVHINPLAPASFQLWRNRLKEMFHKNRAVIYALHLRTFGANDANSDGVISPKLGESGTFNSAIPKLDELQALGVNTVHVLPIHPVSQIMRLGEAGSPYAPSDILSINPEYGTMADAKRFVQEAHRRGINVLMDVPMFPSYKLAQKYPELIARDPYGNPLKPNNWLDVLMFENNGALVDYYENFFKLMDHLGVDGYRVDIARVRPAWFWEYFIGQYPDKAWLAESYSHQDASPIQNIPRDVPEHLLKIGFDAIYGQFHRFPEMRSAVEYANYLVEGHGMLRRAGLGKSFIGSFLTPYDYSLMKRGGVTMNFLAAGLMATQPWTNPYILDGFTTGYEKPFDMFNYRERPTGSSPEVGDFLQSMLNFRKRYENVITQGLFIPIPIAEADENTQIIAFARHHRGKTLMVVANKDVNAGHSAELTIPGVKESQKLTDLVPAYGRKSTFIVDNNKVNIELAPGRIHIFEIDTPRLPLNLQSYR